MQTTDTKITNRIDAAMQRIVEGSTEEHFKLRCELYEDVLLAISKKISKGAKTLSCIDIQRMCQMSYTVAEDMMRDLVKAKVLKELPSDTETFMQGDRIILI